MRRRRRRKGGKGRESAAPQAPQRGKGPRKCGAAGAAKEKKDEKFGAARRRCNGIRGGSGASPLPFRAGQLRCRLGRRLDAPSLEDVDLLLGFGTHVSTSRGFVGNAGDTGIRHATTRYPKRMSGGLT
eukprot:gene2409-biopygen15549